MNLNFKEQIAYLADKSRIALRRGIERLQIKVNHILKRNPHRDVSGPKEEFIEDINDRAFFAYVPRVYPGKMTICRPQRNYAFLRDPFLGWREVAAGGLEVIELPVDPGGIFIEPYVKTLAEKLTQQIDQAVSSGSEIPDPALKNVLV
jgi:aspartate racemase